MYVIKAYSNDLFIGYVSSTNKDLVCKQQIEKAKEYNTYAKAINNIKYICAHLTNNLKMKYIIVDKDKEMKGTVKAIAVTNIKDVITKGKVYTITFIDRKTCKVINDANINSELNLDRFLVLDDYVLNNLKNYIKELE